MKKLTGCLLAVSALGTLAHAQSQGPYTLKLNPKQGMTHTQRFTMSMSMGLDAKGENGQPVPDELKQMFEGMSMNMAMNIATTYSQVGAKQIKGKLKISGIEIGGTGPMAAAGALGDMPKAASGTFTVDPNDPSKMNVVMEAGKGMGAENPLSNLSESGGMNFFYPKKPVMVGDYWDIDGMGGGMFGALGKGLGLGGSMGDMMSVVHFTGVEQVEGRTVGLFETDVTGNPSMDLMGQGAMSMSIHLTGVTRVDMATGLVMSGVSNATMKMDMDMPGQGKMKMNMKMTMKMVTVK